MGKITNKLIIVLFFLFFCVNSSYALDHCKASFINPISDINWAGIFPIEIAGVEIKGPSDELPNPDKVSSVICMCNHDGRITLGVTVSYWEPARIIETNKSPWCFPTLGGIKLQEPNPGTRQGANDIDTGFTQQNAHWLIFSVWNLLDLFTDIPCTRPEGFDIAYITEIDPTWNNDLVGFLLNPEAILFANPVAQLACMADSVASATGWSIDSLFWCMGGQGSAYPLTGNIGIKNYINANYGLAQRMVYKMNREALMWDSAIDKCGAVITPIWVKTHYKMHLIKPVRSAIMPLGRTSVLWEQGKNPSFGTTSNAPDNFSWMLFRRIKCCLGKAF
mgnify:CR=1 FL=1